MTRQVLVGGVTLGGGAPVRIQSMTTVKTSDTEGVCAEIARLEAAGCEIVRGAILDEADARGVRAVKDRTKIPFVADIHFSPKLAVMSIENGADKVRINPGNIGGEAEIRMVADAVKAHRIPARVGANTGSIEPDFLRRYGRSAEALVESALYNVGILERFGVNDIVISVKASSVPLTVAAYRLLSRRTEYPLHVGVTEAGTTETGIVKSSVGIGALLLDGIGDTIRVSLTDDSVKEVYAARQILRACGLDEEYVELVSCPTCGRCRWNSMELAGKVQEYIRNIRIRAKIAVMGCVVNGPGEAKDADLGIAGGDGFCMLFKKGEPFLRVTAAEAEEAFFAQLKLLLEEKRQNNA